MMNTRRPSPVRERENHTTTSHLLISPQPQSTNLPSSQARTGWKTLWQWSVTNTLSPSWLPPRMQRPFLGYLLAALLQMVAVFLTMLLVRNMPTFHFVAAAPFLVILLISIGWGAAPGIFATLIGLVLLVTEILLPMSAIPDLGAGNDIGIILTLILGLSISLLSGQTRRALLHEQQLRVVAENATSQLEAVLEVLPVGVSIADRAGRLIVRNRAALGVWGEHSPDAMNIDDYRQYEGWWTATDKPIAPHSWPMARALTHGEVSLGEEIDIQAFDGQRKTILHFAAPIRDGSGTITGSVTAFLDITERKRLEQMLRQAERTAAERARQMEAVFEAITDGVFVLDASGTPPHLNRAARVLLDLPEETSISVQEGAPFELLDKQGNPLPHEQWPEMRLRRGEQLRGEDGEDVVLRTRTGRIRSLSVTGAPLWNENGKINGGVLVCRDVTARRRLERQTQESLQALLVLAEALVSLPTRGQQDGDIADAEATFDTVSKRLVELIRSLLDCKRASITMLDPVTQEPRSLAVVGLTDEQEQRWRERHPGFQMSDQVKDTPIGRQLATGNPVVIDMREPLFATRPNPYGIVNTLLVPMLLNGQLVGMLALDHHGEAHTYSENEIALAKAVAELAALILERERLLEERAESQANLLALAEANRLKDEFIGIAGHELRTPLTTIKASVQLAKRQVGRLLKQEQVSPEDEGKMLLTMQQLLDRAERQVGMQNRLVNDLLDVSRIESGRLELHPALHDLVTLVSEMVADQQALVPERTIAFERQHVEELLVLVDADRLRQVVTNYLSNALKYSEAKTPVVVRLCAWGSWAQVEVSDQGPGLTEAQQQRIWERFYRVPGIEVRSGSGVGLGLGLHISRMIIERQGGQVGVRSTPGQGSTFWFALPKAEE